MVGIDTREDTLYSSQLYRRQARRLRSVYANRPAQLYRSLRQLSDRHDARPAVGESAPTASTAPQERSRAFAQFVSQRLEGNLLRYSTRLELLDIAAAMGLERFHANLMIAAVQHQRGLSIAVPNHSRRSLGWPAMMLIALLLQSAILFVAWNVFVQ